MPIQRFKRWLHRELFDPRDDMIGNSWIVIVYGTAGLLLVFGLLARCSYEAAL